MKRSIVIALAAILSAATVPTIADEHVATIPERPCQGPTVLVCAALAVPVAVAIIDRVIDAACPGAYLPGEWPEDALASGPVYPGQWYRECEIRDGRPGGS